MSTTELEKDLLKVAEKKTKELELITLLLDKSVNTDFSPNTQQDYHFAAYWTSQAFKYYHMASFASESFYAKTAKSYQQKAETVSVDVKEFFTKNSDNYVF